MENTTKQIDPVKAKIALIYGNLAKQQENFKDRPQQKKLINAIATVIGSEDENASLVAEAPTGTGKSLALLMASLPYAIEKDLKLIVSTATTALQDQLITKDIPKFLTALDEPVSFVAIKGRSRYACPRNLFSALDPSAQVDDQASSDVFERPVFKFKPTESDIQTIKTLSDTLTDHSWDGDRDTLHMPVSSNVWSAVSTDSNGCSRAKCSNFKDCPYYAKKKLVEESRIIVTNQDFLLSDMALGTGVILPSYEKSIIIVDEGHHFPSKAVESSATRYAIKYHVNVIAKVESLLNKLRSVVMSFTYDTHPIADLSLELSKRINDTYAMFDSLFTKNIKPNEEFCMLSDLDDAVRQFLQGVATIAKSTTDKISELFTALEAFVKERELESDLTDKLLKDIDTFNGFVRTTLSTYQSLADTDPLNAPPLAKWIEKNSKGNDYFLNTSSIDASSFIAETLISNAFRTIFLSATITNLGTFDAFIKSTGLGAKKYYSLKVDSPFDYTRSTIYLPPIKSNSNDLDKHAVEVAEIINSEPLDAPEGSLYIMTSKKKLNAVVANLSARVKPYVIVQDGLLSKNAIIEKHKAAIDANNPSVIIGLTSFSEGVDLAGAYCTHVLLDKLPFAPVNDPIQITKTAYLVSQGRDPFQEISLPDAFIKLTQITGRLIRTEDDVGKITICDNRTRSKGYAKLMIKSLPPFSVVT